MLTPAMRNRGAAAALAGVTCIAMVLGLAFAATPRAAAGEVLLPDCGNVFYGGSVAPVEWSSGCVGASVNLDQLSWRDWGAPVATATGIVHYNDCSPSCAAGSISDYPAELHVEQIRRCASPLGPQSYYTRFTTIVTYPPENAADQPPGPSEPFAFSSSCPTPGYLVKTRSRAATFGAFVESGEYDGDGLERYFGPPSRRKRKGRYFCVKHWHSIGLTVTVGSIEPGDDPCYSGRFIGAILKGSRWHTPSGVRPGGPRSQGCRRERATLQHPALPHQRLCPLPAPQRLCRKAGAQRHRGHRRRPRQASSGALALLRVGLGAWPG